MRHLALLSKQRPAVAQFESAIQLVGLFQAMLSLFRSVADTFWIEIPHKEPDKPEQ